MDVLLNVFETSMQKFKVWRVPVIADQRVIFQKIKELSQRGVADLVFSNGLLYFKGEPKKVIEELLREKEQIFIGEPLEEVVLSPQDNKNLIRGLLYSSLERAFRGSGWQAPIGKRKRALPQIYKNHEDLYSKLKEDVVVLFGLKYMFEIASEESLRLWLDVYASLWSLSEKRRLHIKEIDAGLKELYFKRALLRPRQRYERTLKLVETIFGDKGIKLEFCDGDVLSFSRTPYKAPLDGERVESGIPLCPSMIEEPYLRFKFGLSQNPRDIVRLRAYEYGISIKHLPIKAIVEKSVREDLLDFLRKMVNGFSGIYMRWPGFRTVTGTELSFDDSDIISLDDFSEDALRESLLQVFSESGGKAVVLLVIPRPLHKLYYEVKALALQKMTPVQVILRETLKKDLLEFTLMNIGVALYAKGGGIPWILAKPLMQSRGLFIGISFHLDHESKNIYYGVMEVFDKFGRHLKCKIRMYSSSAEIRSVRGLYIPRSDAEKVLNDLIKEYNPREIIFHKSAPFHSEEREAIEKVCKERGISYCLVHIERTNPYRIYAENAKRGDFTPIRGTVVFDLTNKDRAILCTTGHSMVSFGIRSWSGIGTPKPLEVTLEKNTTRYSLREIVEQILSMTKLDWNTTEISLRSPITLKYSNKAAKLTPYLKSDIKRGLTEIAEIKFLM